MPAGIEVRGAGTIDDGDTSPLTGEGTDFGSANQGASHPTKKFTVQNTGGDTLQVGALSVSGSGFEIASGLPATLAPGSSADFQVEMLTATAGQKSSVISFTTNASGHETFNFSVRGEVATVVTLSPEIEVEADGSGVSSGGATEIDLGAAGVSAPGPAKTFIVRNEGTSNLSLGALSVPAGFTMTDPLETTLAPGSSDSFAIQLATATSGSKSGTVSFSTNDADENPFTFNVAGIVRAAGNLQPEVTLLVEGSAVQSGSAAVIDFGSVTVGGTGNIKVLTVRNDGACLLTSGTPVLPAGFTLVDPLENSIDPGTTDTFSVQLDAASLGTKAGVISFTSNDADENPFTLNIAGAVTPVVQPPAGPIISGVSLVKAPKGGLIVGGDPKAKGVVGVTFSNTAARPIANSVTVEVRLSTDSIFDASDVLFGTLTKSLKLANGVPKALKVKGLFPTVGADSDLFLVASATGIAPAAGPQVAIKQRRISLSLPAAGPFALTIGRPLSFSFPLVNSGTVAAKGFATASIDLLTTEGEVVFHRDVATPVKLNATLLKPASVRLKLVPLDPAVIAGNYQLKVSLIPSGLAAPLIPDGTVTQTYNATVG